MNCRFAFAAAVWALAWSATTAAQAPSPMPAIPTHQCVKPEIPGERASSMRVETFNRQFTAYADCVKKYVADTKALINAAATAGNTAIEEFNKFAADVKAQTEAK